MSAAERPRVVIAGGGIAGLEALMALHHLAGDRLQVTLVAPQPDFVYRPLAVEEPFSAQPPEQRALAPITEEFGASFVMQPLVGADAEARRAQLGDGSGLEYEKLIVCVGARSTPAFKRAITFSVPGPQLAIDDLIAKEDAHVAFVVPPGVTWALPLYELALMAKRRAGELGSHTDCTIVTPESAPLIIFGTVASDAVSELLGARGIEVIAGARAHEGDRGTLILSPGDRRLEAKDVVALPAIEGPQIPGLPADELGFLPIDEHARVRGCDDVYAAGDGTNFPIKQGGLGTQQADAAAEHISAAAGADVDAQPFRPVLRGQLLTGPESLYLRGEPTGGGGEGVASVDSLWWPPHKVSGRYLSAWLAGMEPHADVEPPRQPLDIDVALPVEWHKDPMALDPYDPLP
jgi:sulfide:quinone oxidoreductase